jgi:hypothetical protein
MRSANRIASVLIAGLVAGCMGSTGAVPPSPSASRTESTAVATMPAPAPATRASDVPTRSPVPVRAPTALPSASASSCAVTRPEPAFAAPAPWPAHAPGDNVWFGTSDLWAMLSPDGEVWSGLPYDAQGFGQKTFWWSSHFLGGNKEPTPAIGVIGTRLDGPGTFQAGDPGTNAGNADIGSAMLVGVEFPAAGCWRLTARYRGFELPYIVQVTDD